MNDESERIWTEAIVSRLKELPWHLFGGTKTLRTVSEYAVCRLIFRSGNSGIRSRNVYDYSVCCGNQ
jgi:hypothetical protein